MHGGTGAACDARTVQVGRFADVFGLERDEGEGRIVEADVDGNERRTRILRVELDHRRHVDPAEIVDTPGDAHGNVGGALTGVYLNVEPIILVVAFRLRNE